jgi:hypothetical protein
MTLNIGRIFVIMRQCIIVPIIGNDRPCQDEIQWTTLGVLKPTHLCFLPLETYHAHNIILFLFLYL